jgi:hypothetical protein
MSEAHERYRSRRLIISAAMRQTYVRKTGISKHREGNEMKTRLIALSLFAAASFTTQAALANPERDFDWQQQFDSAAAQPLRNDSRGVSLQNPERDFDWHAEIAAVASQSPADDRASAVAELTNPERDFDLQDEIDQMKDSGR